MFEDSSESIEGEGSCAVGLCFCDSSAMLPAGETGVDESHIYTFTVLVLSLIFL